MTPPLCPTLSLLVTYRCNLRCRHCGPLCGPDESDRMSMQEMLGLIRQAAALGAANVVFTGGEPTLLGEDLEALLRFVRDETPIASTRLVTNATWATSPAAARRRLAAWKDAGLDEVNISCGEYHQEFVPLPFLAHAYHAACDLDFDTVLLAGEFLAPGRGRIEPETICRAVGARLPDPEWTSPYARRVRGLTRGAAMNYGRGARHVPAARMDTRPSGEIPGLCSDVLSAVTAHPDGQLTACCGVMVRQRSLLSIGDWRRQPLRRLLDAAREDLVLNWIRYLGLHDMRDWLRLKDPTLPLRDRHASICDLCAEVTLSGRCRDLLIEQGAERRDDILANRLAMAAGPEAGDAFVYAGARSRP